VVEVVSNNGGGLLRHRRGNPWRFRSLAEARQVLNRCGVGDAVLRQRVAHDEACTAPHGASGARFHDLPFPLNR
jgi:hypothetical protein